MKSKSICCYCGNETKNGKLFHKMCLIDDIYQTIYDGKRITKNLYCRCKDSGISTKEIRSDVEEDKKGTDPSAKPQRRFSGADAAGAGTGHCHGPQSHGGVF